MEQIEAAVGQGDGFAGAPPFVYALAQRFAVQDFVACVQ
jgi:hypothetical protein